MSQPTDARKRRREVIRDLGEEVKNDFSKGLGLIIVLSLNEFFKIFIQTIYPLQKDEPVVFQKRLLLLFSILVVFGVTQICLNRNSQQLRDIRK
jgi:hypothetical protein